MSVVATLLVRVAANLSELDKTFSELERAADRVARTYTKLGGQLQSIGGKLTTSITLPIVAMGAAAAKSAVDFDTAMRGVQAAVQPTTAELDQLQAAAIEWGQKTQYSATEAAQALGELGKAGIKSADSIKLLPSVLNLATVGEMDLATAAALTTDTLAQFKLEAKDSEKVNDVLAAAAQASTTSVKELGDALKYAGPVAGAFGMSIAETGAALAQFAKLGVKGEMAGTALRNVLAEIKNPAKGMRDVLADLNIATLASADGTVHLTDVIAKLQERGATASQIMQAFGDRAGPAMVAAVGRGAAELRVLTGEMERSEGTAKRVAETLLSGIGGALEKMRGAVETAGISLGTLLAPAIVLVADLISSLAEFVSSTLVPAFQALPEVVQVGIGGFIGLVAAIGPLVYIAGTLASSYGALAGLLGKSAAGAKVAATAAEGLAGALTAQSVAARIAALATGAFEAVLAVLMSPVTLVIAGVAALVLGLRYLTGSWEGVLKVLSLGLLDFRRVGEIMAGLQSIVTDLGEAFRGIGSLIGDAASVINADLQPALDTVRGLLHDVGLAADDPAAKNLRGFKASAGEAQTGAFNLAGVLQSLLLPAISNLTLQWGLFDRVVAGADSLKRWVYYAQGIRPATVEVLDAFTQFKTGLVQTETVLDSAGLAASIFGESLRDQLAAGAATATRALVPTAAAAHASASAIKAAAAAAKKAAEDAKRAAEEFQKLQDQMSGAAVVQKARDLMTTLAALTAQGLKPSAAGAREITEAISDASAVLHAKGQRIADDMADVWQSFQVPRNLADDLRNYANLIAGVARNLVPTLKQNLKPMQQAFVDAFRIDAKQVGKNVEDALQGAALVDRVKKWGADMQQEVTGILSRMFTGQTGFHEGFAAMFGSLQGIGSTLLQDFGQTFMAEFNDVLKGGSFDWGNLFGGDKNKAAGAAAGAAVGLTVGLAFGKSFGKTVGVLVGAGSGAAMGAVYGNWVGAGVGAAVGAISGYLGGLTQERAQRAALESAKSQLVATFGTMEKLSEAATQAGIDFHQLFDTKDPQHFTRVLNLMNVELEKNKAAVTAMATALDRTTNSAALLSRVDLSNLALTTGRLPDADARTKAKGALGGSEQAALAFIEAQQKSALDGLDKFLTNAKIKTQAGAQAISASLAGIYQSLLETGASPTQAFAQMEPVIAKLQAQLQATGLAGSVAFGPLGALARLAADAIGGPVMDAMAGLAQGLTSTFNLGLLNQDTFHGFAQEVLAGFKAMEALGQGGEVALAGAQQGIQKLWELSQDFGYTLSDDEQAMVDFGLASGTIGEKFRPAADRMANAIDALVDRMDQFLLKFSEIMPAASDAARDIENTLGSVKVPPVDIPLRPRWPDDYTPGGPTVPAGMPTGMAVLGAGGIVTRPTVALIGERGPEAVVPLSKDFGGDTDVIVMLDSEVLTRAVLRKQPRVMRAYGVAR